MLEVKDLSLSASRTGKLLVDNLSFSILPRQIVGIAGLSAAGKTVSTLALFRRLPDTVRVAGGTVRLLSGSASREVFALNEQELASIRGKSISYIFQEPRKSLNPVIKVGTQIDEIFVCHHSATDRAARQKTMQLLSKVGFSHPERVYHCYPHQLSGGECQRIVIASAVALQPVLIIADEPTASLDVTTETLIVELLLERTREAGAALIFITHNMYLLSKIAQKIVFLAQGRKIHEQAHVPGQPLVINGTDPSLQEMLASIPAFGKKIEI